MQLDPIIAPTIKEMFTGRIEEMILSGRLPVGTQLPTERELAEQMKISKTAVHAGICDMVRKGFLEVIPRRGTFVADYARCGTLETLVSMTNFTGGNLDERNIRSLLEMRCAIERVALENVIARRDSATLQALEEISEAAAACAHATPPDILALAEQYFLFHHRICVDSGNTIAPLIMNAFRVPSIHLWANSARRLGIEESLRRLRCFVDYIREGDLPGALTHLQLATLGSLDDVADV